MRSHLVLTVFICGVAASAQEALRTLSAADYAYAERFMSYNTTPLVLGAVTSPSGIGSDRFSYRVSRDGGGFEFMLVNGAHGTKAPAFDDTRLLAALSTATGSVYPPGKLPFTQIDLAEDGKKVSFSTGGKHWKCDLEAYLCATETAAPRNEAPSPDKTKIAFLKDYNLWVRDRATGMETQLTKDGVKDFGYATDNAGWTHSDRPVLLWSPDSRKIATFQQDQRGVGEMYLVNTQVGHPKLEAWKYPLPGDDVVTTIQRVIIDVATKKVTRFKMPPDQHRSTLCDDLVCSGSEWVDVEWSPDGSKFAFVSSSRDHKQAILREADAVTGDVREVYQETVATQYESGDGKSNWRVLWGSNQFLWYSERSGWGHLYLGDWKTGQLKGPVTSGNWLVRQVLRVDDKARMIYFLGAGREKGDPYFSYLYRVGLDGNGMQLLTREEANHEVTLSKSGEYFLDSYSKPDVPAVTVLRNRDGRLIATLEKEDITKLVAAGWKPPLPITVKARDGVTDLYGLLFVPTHLEAGKKYPIVNHIYPGPQGGSVGPRSFYPSRGDTQALAELGFVVIEIDGMGNPTRSKAFHDFYYGDMGDNTLPDQVTGMEQIAVRYPFVDISQAGIYGHSGGGYAAADAMFRYPDFFKVGISEAGNHDNRDYEDDWGERYQGLLKELPGGGTNYDDQANENHAQNLKGHLLLAHGTTDSNVPPYNTLLVVNELIKANKDFDLLLLPNRNHGFGNEPYMIRRRWDYFVRYLLGAEPPKGYELKPQERRPG